MQKKIFFIFFLIADIISAYKLLEAFPSFMSRVLGFSVGLFFVHALIILWIRYLTHQPEEVQREIVFPRIDKTGLTRSSLYDILHFQSAFKRFQFLYYTEAVFSGFVVFFLIFITFMFSVAPSAFDVSMELRNALSFPLLLYYIGFCLGTIITIITAIIQQKKSDVLESLRLEYVIKLLQVVFITMFYEVAVGPAFGLIVLTSVMRLDIFRRRTPLVEARTQNTVL